MMDKFTEFYMMQNQAKKLEKSGLDDKALELYLKIIAEYQPNDDFSFDRAATLLEKKSRHADAIAVCEKAIQKIKSENIEGNVFKFQQKIDRIREKVKSDLSTQPVAAAKRHEEFRFGLPGFRTPNKLVMILATAYYGLAAYSSYPDQFYTFLFMFSMAFVGSFGLDLMMKLHNNKVCFKTLAVTLIALGISGYSLTHVPQFQVYFPVGGFVQSGEIDGTPEESEAPEPIEVDAHDRTPPEIPANYLATTEKVADKYPGSDHAIVVADKKTVIIELIVNPGTDLKTIEEISHEMIKTLGGLMTSEELKGPTDTSLGELYDFYSVTIVAIDTLEQPVNQGILTQKATEIKWVTPIENPTSSP